jgi:glutaredoxin
MKKPSAPASPPKALTLSRTQAKRLRWAAWSLPLAAAALLLISGQAHALYKVVQPDGTVTYTDRPPQTQATATGSSTGTGAANGAKKTGSATITTVAAAGAASVDPSSLPYEVKMAAQKSPVVLYTVEKCAPCDQGRSLLRQRGIPFQERTAKTNEDRDAWKEATGGTQAPVLTVGSQKFSGFQESSWTSSLDAAGYPKANKLPGTYQQAQASSIAPERAAAKPAGSSRPSRDASPALATQATPSAPGGIRF